MGNCCGGESSILVAAGDEGRAPPPTNHGQKKHSNGENNGANSSSCSSSSRKGSKGGSLREVKIRMTKKELEELVGWLNMADSSFEQLMARGLVNVISDQRSDEEEDDHNNGHLVRLRQQRSWRPSLYTIPEIN